MMLAMIKNNGIAFALSAVVFVALYAGLLRWRLDVAHSQIELVTTQKQQLQLNVDELVHELSGIEFDNNKLRQQLITVATLNKQNVDEKQQISDELNQKIALLEQAGENSDEVKDWSNTPVPVDVIRLFHVSTNN